MHISYLSTIPPRYYSRKIPVYVIQDTYNVYNSRKLEKPNAYHQESMYINSVIPTKEYFTAMQN